MVTVEKIEQEVAAEGKRLEPVVIKDLRLTDIAAAEALGAQGKTTLSQNVGFALFENPRPWWALSCSWILSALAYPFEFRRHHCVRSLYGDDGALIRPDLTPMGAPKTDPYR
jgi:hypothetical protein